MLFLQKILDGRAFAFAKAGTNITANSAKQAMVTRSSVLVNALVDLVRGACICPLVGLLHPNG